jgi:hypothetical protein
MSDGKKCAHEGCSCMAAPGSKFCSNYCKDAKSLTTLQCDCRHAECAGHKL